MIAVSTGKHANYRSNARCNDTFYSEYGDYCYGSTSNPFRFPIEQARNAGSRFQPLMRNAAGLSCVASIATYLGNGKEECFYTAQPFKGWHPGLDGEASYFGLLMSDKFEGYGTDMGPGPARAMLVRVTATGPAVITRTGSYVWTATSSYCNPTCTLQWRISADGGVSFSSLGTGTTQTLTFGTGSAGSYTLEVTAYTSPSESFAARYPLRIDLAPSGCPNNQRVC
jgi:hypothetical protein